MAFINFVGSGTITGEFTIDNVVVSDPVLPGEYRLQKPFPYINLDRWRRETLIATSSIEAWDTRGRTVVLFAHEADMGSLFFDLTDTPPEKLTGTYNYKRKAILADKDLTAAINLKNDVYKELRQQGIPQPHIDLIQQRVESAAFNHRVSGMCAAVYLTALLLEQAEAIA